MENGNKITSTSNQKFKLTSKDTRTSKHIRGSFDFPLRDSELESFAHYLAQQLEETSLLPKYRYAVSYFPLPLLEKALAAAKDCEARGMLKKNRAAYFWATLKRLPKDLPK